MPGHAYTRHHGSSPATEFRESTSFMRWELAPEERIGRPIARKRRWPLWSALTLIFAVVAGALYWVDDKAETAERITNEARHLLSRAMAAAAAMMSAAEAPEQPALPKLSLFDAALLQASPQLELPTRDVAAAPVAAVATAPSTDEAKGAENAEASQSAETEAADKPAPLPPLPPLTDPLQKKAEAAGLHPELSRSLLQSLSEVDFKNAAVGIRKAIVETPADGVLVWPPQPSAGLARFRIHFVPGISPACRRYVVGVAKSGWLTTALPMERCGLKPRLARVEIRRIDVTAPGASLGKR